MLKRYSYDLLDSFPQSFSEMQEDKEGDYVRFSDLLALNPLVAVPYREPCALMHFTGSHCIIDGELRTIFGRSGAWVSLYPLRDGDELSSVEFRTIVQPVRLVSLAAMEGES